MHPLPVPKSKVLRIARYIYAARSLAGIGHLSLDDATRELTKSSARNFKRAYGNEDITVDVFERARLKVSTYRVLGTDTYVPAGDVAALHRPLRASAHRLVGELKQKYTRDQPVERTSHRPLEHLYQEMDESKKNVITTDEALRMLDADRADKFGFDLLRMHLALRSHSSSAYFIRQTFG